MSGNTAGELQNAAVNIFHWLTFFELIVSVGLVIHHCERKARCRAPGGWEEEKAGQRAMVAAP